GEPIAGIRSRIGGVQFPWFIADLLPLLPPAGRGQNIHAAIAIDIAVAQAVRESPRARNLLALCTGGTYRESLPGLRRIFPWPKPEQLAHVLGHLTFRSFLLHRHHQMPLSRAEQVHIAPRFIAAA